MRSLAHDGGRSVVIVTHDPRVADFADRTVRIEDGKIAEPSPAFEEVPHARVPMGTVARWFEENPGLNFA